MIRLSAVLVCLMYLTIVLPADAQSGSSCSNEAYENHNQVDYGPLNISRVDGYATDPSGAPVPKACVLLFAEKDHSLVSKAETDSDGHFNLTRVKNGRYRLVVKSYGFCTANVPIRLTAGAGGKQLAVHMKMGTVDSCSYGDLK